MSYELISTLVWVSFLLGLLVIIPLALLIWFVRRHGDVRRTASYQRHHRANPDAFP